MSEMVENRAIDVQIEPAEIGKTNTLPKVSIVTPSYNQGAFVEQTILSVICQNYSNLEYILVDANSQDQTQAVLESYKQHIDVLIVEPDRGQSEALNKGFRRATGEIMAYLNSDDCYASKEVISRVVTLFAEDPDTDVIYGQRNSINEDGRFVYRQPFRPFDCKALYLSDYIPQECTFWRRSIFEKAGGYIDESFQFAMDYELWLRFLQVGAKFLSVEDVFGLFRTYNKQKSIEQWHSRGLPEIARLHKTYLDRYIPEEQMIDHYKYHCFGVHPATNPNAFDFAQRVWGGFTQHKRELFNHRFDRWSQWEYRLKFGQPLPKVLQQEWQDALYKSVSD